MSKNNREVSKENETAEEGKRATVFLIDTLWDWVFGGRNNMANCAESHYMAVFGGLTPNIILLFIVHCSEVMSSLDIAHGPWGPAQTAAWAHCRVCCQPRHPL